jgi:hypothetical protein
MTAEIDIEDYKSQYNEREWAIAKPLLSNAYRSVTGTYTILNNYPSVKLDTVLRLTNATIKKLLFFTNIVGIQSMQGPVGLIYLMDYYSKPNAMQLKSSAVEAKSRKMRAGWYIEAVQDAKALHGQSTEAVFEDALAQEIIVEYTDMILESLRNAAFRTLGADIAHMSVENITRRIKLESSYIQNKASFKKGNYTILSSKNFKLLFPDVVLAKSDMGILDSGMTIDNDDTDIKVYVSDFMEDDVLVGLNDSNGNTDVGFVLCPYVLLLCNIVCKPDTMEPYMSITTRYRMECTKERAERYYTVFRLGERVVEPIVERLFENDDMYKLM